MNVLVNKIISAISTALFDEFGENYEIYKESVKQGLKEPCFLISCLSATNELSLGTRYFRQNQFLVQYFPPTDESEQTDIFNCYEMLEKLYQVLELISVDDKLCRGSSMNGQVDDEVLSFVVSFDMFVYKSADEEDPMEEMSVQTNANS